MEVYNHLNPSNTTWTLISRLVHTLKAIDYNQLIDLYKSYIVLRGVMIIGKAHGWILINAIYNYTFKSSHNMVPKSTTPLVKVLPSHQESSRPPMHKGEGSQRINM